MEEINVEKIMSDIREEIKERGLKEEDLSFEKIKKEYDPSKVFNYVRLETQLNMANQLAMINPNLDDCITGNAISRFLKKIIRRIICFYVEPLVHKQNEFNKCTMDALNEMNLYIQELEELRKEGK